MLNMIPTQMIVSDCKKAHMYIENDMPLGSFHDFLLLVKGYMVDRMVTTQKQEEEVAKEQMAVPAEPTE